MKKSILIAGSVLSFFILVSISYQPIKADEYDSYFKSEYKNIYFILAIPDKPVQINESNINLYYRFFYQISYFRFDGNFVLSFTLDLDEGSMHLTKGGIIKFIGINNENIFCGFIL